MGIYEEQNKRKEVNVIESLAQKLYNKQLRGITNIAHTDGYKDIKKYWQRVEEGAIVELQNVTTESLKITQLKRKIANEFVTFLENLEKAKATSEKVK